HRMNSEKEGAEQCVGTGESCFETKHQDKHRSKRVKSNAQDVIGTRGETACIVSDHVNYCLKRSVIICQNGVFGREIPESRSECLRQIGKTANRCVLEDL